MRAVWALVLLALLSAAAAQESTTDFNDKLNTIEPSKTSVRLDPYIREALRKALNELEESDQFTTETETPDGTTNTEILRTGDDISTDTAPTEATKEDIQFHSFIVNGQAAFTNLSSNAVPTLVDNRISILTTTAGNVENQVTAILPTQTPFNEIFQGRETVNLQQVRSISPPVPNNIDNTINKDTTLSPTTSTSTTTTTTTTTTPKPTHNNDGENIEDVDKRDVQVFQAPLVAAFTVHQDAQGQPKKVVPIYQQTTLARDTIQTVPASRIPNVISQAGSLRSNLQLIENPNSVQSEIITQQLALQKQLEEKQRLLEEQLRFLQQQQRQQEELLRKQQFLLQQKQQQQFQQQQNFELEQFKKQQQINGQQRQQQINEQQREQQINEQQRQQQINEQQRQQQINEQQRQQQINEQQRQQQSQVVSSIQINEQRRQQQINEQQRQQQSQVVSSIQIQSLPKANENHFNQQQNSFRQQNAQVTIVPSVSLDQTNSINPLNGFTVNNQQLPNREAVDFLLSLRNQQPTQFPLQENHLPQGITNFLQPGQQINNFHQGANLNQLRPFEDPFRQKQGNRVFRQESGVGNFGFNQNYNRFNTFNPAYTNRFFAVNRNNQFQDNELKQLLGQSGLNGRNHEDLNIVTKVLSLNHGIPLNNNISNRLPFDSRRHVRNPQ